MNNLQAQGNFFNQGYFIKYFTMKWYFAQRWFDELQKWKNLYLSQTDGFPHLPRSAIELAVQLFCIPVEGRKSESNDRLESKLESKILEERTSLMRLDTWSWNEIIIKVSDILTQTDLTVLRVWRMSLNSPTCNVPVVRPLTVLKHFISNLSSNNKWYNSRTRGSHSDLENEIQFRVNLLRIIFHFI